MFFFQLTLLNTRATEHKEIAESKSKCRLHLFPKRRHFAFPFRISLVWTNCTAYVYLLTCLCVFSLFLYSKVINGSALPVTAKKIVSAGLEKYQRAECWVLAHWPDHGFTWADGVVRIIIPHFLRLYPI